MPQSDLLKELESLKKRIETLESKASDKNSLQMFGRSYSQAGSSNSDFVIKTKGQVKIQWGSKYIDLIKDGKINANFKFIYQTDKVGTKDGIYVVGENKDVILVIDGNSITLSSQGGNTYVSFQDIQTADSDQKHTALKNIGLIYENYSDVEQAQIKNGIVYVESEKKLYTILNGVVSEFSVSIPNPYTQQFVIAKNDSKNGALVIKGTGLTNSVLFNTSYIYEEDFRLVLNTPSGLYIKLGDNYKIKVENDTVLFTDKITAPSIQSSNASSDYGYRLYMQNGQSTLEVDNIIVRNADISNQNTLYPTTWNYNNNIISSIQQQEQDNQYNITLKYENTFKVGSQLYVYLDTKLSSQDITYNSLYIISFIIQSIDKQSIVVTLSDTIDSEIYNDFNFYFSLLTNQTIFEIGNTKSIRLVRQSKDGLDLLESTGINDEKTLSNVKTRIGDLTNLGLKGKSNDDEVSIEGLGVYSSNGVFDSIQYSKDYNLPQDDNSSKLASTEWVRKLSSDSTVDIDFTINELNILPEDYFSRMDIRGLEAGQKFYTTKTYVGKYGFITIDKQEYITTYSGIVRSKIDNDLWSHRSLSAMYSLANNTWYNQGNYLIKDHFNPGYYYSTQQLGNKPVSPIYIGTDLRDFQVDSKNKYLWYTNDGETWILVQEYVDPIQDVLYIRTTTRNFYAVEDVQYPAGFICYNDGSTNVAIGNGRGVSNYLEVLNEYVERKPLTILQNIESIAVKGQIPVMDGYNWLWSLKSGSDPTKYDSWTLVSGIGSSVPVVYDLDRLSFGNCGGITSGVVWTKVDESGVNTGSIDSSELTNGDGTESDWNNSAFVRSFLVTAFSDFLRRNIARYTDTLGWSFNYDSIVHLKGWGGYINFYIGSPENPTSDDINNIDSLPKSVFLWVNGSVFCNGHKADFYFDSVSPGLKINVGQCYQENIDVGKTANITTFFDITYKGLRVQVTDLPQIN